MLCAALWECERSCVNTAHGASHYYQNSLELLLIVVAPERNALLHVFSSEFSKINN